MPLPAVVRAGGVVAVLVAAFTTCRDALGPREGTLARVAVAPIFPSGAAMADFGLTIDRIRIIVVLPVADTIADTTAALPPDADFLDLDFRVPLLAARESLSVTIEALAGSIPLFSGTSLVEVRAGVSAPPPTEIAVTTYVGPGAGVDSIAVLPSAPFIYLDDSLRFQVQAFQAGAPVTQFYVSWATSDTGVAPINGFGVLRAPSARTSVLVRARTPSGAADSALVTFVPLPTEVIVVAGAGQSGTVGQVLETPLEAEVRAADGLPVGGVSVRFRSLSGGVPADTSVVSDAAGRARVPAVLGTTAGPQSFEASLPGFLGIGAVTFGATAIAGQISAATSLITASTGTVLSGADVLLTLQGKDAAGNDVTSGGAAVVFTATGGTSSGTIGPTTDHGDGTYTATFTGITAGTATTIGAVIDDVAVTSTPLPTIAVLTGAIASVVVSPGSALLGALNATQRFSAAAFDGNGNPVATTFAWTSSAPLVASVDGTGLATALANGAVTIAASSGGVADSADLTVQQVVASVAVTPTDVLLTVIGETVQLAAEARDSGGSAVSGATFTWSSSDTLAGTVDATGLVTAVAAGATDVTAATAGGQGVARVTVNLLGMATRLVFVQQPPSPVFFGEQFTVRVEAQDEAGNTVTGFSGDVVLNENTGSQNSLSKLQGTLTQPVVKGVATFTDLFVDGTDTTAIDATTSGLAGATSNTFEVVNQIVLKETGAAPYFAGVDTVTNRIYLSNTSGGSASVVEAATHKVVNVIGLGSNPGWEGVNPVTKRVFISDSSDGAVYVIDESIEKVETVIPVGASPTQPAVNPASDTIYVPARGEVLNLMVVDVRAGKVVDSVAIGGTGDNAAGAVWDPATNLVWVVIASQGSIKSVDPAGRGVVDSIFVGDAPYGIALDTKLNRLYVTVPGRAEVRVIDIATKELQTILVGELPQGLSVDSESGRVFVANSGQKSLSVIDGNQGIVIKTIPVGSGPGDAEYNPRNRLVYVPNGNDNSLSIVKP